MYTKVFSELDGVLVDRDAPGIAKSFAALVHTGILPVGSKLPPIRQVASYLGVSTATVSQAWTIMASHRMIETDRRRGTTVCERPTAGQNRYWQVPVQPGTLALDLSTGTPDPRLLPRLEPILRRIVPDLAVQSYVQPPLLEVLEQRLLQIWPYKPAAITVVDGALDGFVRAANCVVRLGDRVVVEDPTYPPLLDALDRLGAEVVGVPMTAGGLDLRSLERVFKEGARALVLQTGAHNPTGSQLSRQSLESMIPLIDGHEVVVIEDVQGWVREHNFLSVGTYLPDQTIRIQSFSKTHGPDMRIAALAGTERLVNELVDHRQIGPGWTSRFTQRVLAAMLASETVEEEIRHAVGQYKKRRESLAEALDGHGFKVGRSHGLNLWVPVADEHAAVVALAAQGIGVAPGAPFRVGTPGQHLRVTTAGLDDGFDDVARMIAAAARGVLPR